MRSSGNQAAVQEENRPVQDLPEVLDDRVNSNFFSKCFLSWPTKLMCFLACKHQSEKIRVEHLWKMKDNFAGELRDRISETWDEYDKYENPNLIKVLRDTFLREICCAMIWHVFLAAVTVVELAPVMVAEVRDLAQRLRARGGEAAATPLGTLWVLATPTIRAYRRHVRTLLSQSIDRAHLQLTQ